MVELFCISNGKEGVCVFSAGAGAGMGAGMGAVILAKAGICAY